MAILITASCTEEALEVNPPMENEQPVLTRTKSDVVPLSTTCDILGNFSPTPGSVVTYTYSSNIAPNVVNWSIQSGNMTIISGQGTRTVTVRLSSNFTIGRIFADGFGGGNISCAKSKVIIAPCVPPTFVSIRQETAACHGQIVAFNAFFDGNTSGTYQWATPVGGSIVSGQGTSRIRVLVPPFGGFGVTVTYLSGCKGVEVSDIKLGEFTPGCD